LIYFPLVVRYRHRVSSGPRMRVTTTTTDMRQAMASGTRPALCTGETSRTVHRLRTSPRAVHRKYSDSVLFLCWFLVVSFPSCTISLRCVVLSHCSYTKITIVNVRCYHFIVILYLPFVVDRY